jgi:hypothetical protein
MKVSSNPFSVESAASSSKAEVVRRLKRSAGRVLVLPNGDPKAMMRAFVDSSRGHDECDFLLGMCLGGILF